MIGLLNLAGFLIVGLGGYLTYRYRSWKIAVATLVLLLGYNHFQPSYMPKGEVSKAAFVEPTASDKPMVDRMLKPKSSEEYDAKRQAEFDKIDARIKRNEY